MRAVSLPLDAGDRAREHHRQPLHRARRLARDVGDHQAMVPEVAGGTFITGCHTFVLDPDDFIGKRLSCPVIRGVTEHRSQRHTRQRTTPET